MRVRITHKLAQRRRARLTKRVSAADRAQLAEQGYVLIPEYLPAEEFEALRDAIIQRVSDAREMHQGNAITRRIAIDGAMMRDIPALRTLLRQPRWSGLMRYVSSFNVEPLYYIQTILTHKRSKKADPQNTLHADTFHPTMKAWFFLTDVAEEDGPLCYVNGSHKMTAERLQWERERAVRAPEGVDRLSARGSMRIMPEELPALGLSPATCFAVPANTLVVADTCGFHARSPAARASMRIEIWAYSRRNPFIPWLGGDVLSLPGLAERRIGWLWTIRDHLKKWMGQPWRYVGKIPPNSNG